MEHLKMHAAQTHTGQTLVEDINRCRLPDGQCAFWWLGQHSFVVKFGETICYFDPYLSPESSRQVPPLLRPEELTNAAIIFGSHDHTDHIDRATWPAIAAASPNATFIVPQLLERQIIEDIGLPRQRVRGIDQDVNIQMHGLTITAIPAAHEFLDIDEATGLHPFLGFIVEGHGVKVYHAGDTCIYEGMHALLRRHAPIDLAFLPINGRDARRLKANCIGNMTYQEAVDLAGSLKFGLTVPAHFEMFKMNSQDPQAFVDYMTVKYPKLKCMTPVHGRRSIVPASR